MIKTKLPINAKQTLLLLGVIVASFCIFFPLYHQTEQDLDAFQSRFEKVLHEEIRQLNHFSDQLEHEKVSSISGDGKYLIHVYRNDSLINWNTNQMPVWHFTDFQFPTNGLIHLQNGWYYTKVVEKGKTRVCVSLLIQRDYAYENRDLQNTFAPPFEFANGHFLEVNPEQPGMNDLQGNYLVSLIPKKEEPSRSASILLLVGISMLTSCILAWSFWISRSSSSPRAAGLYIFGALLVRWLLLQAQFSNLFVDFEVSNPHLFASSTFTPSFVDFVLHILFAVAILQSTKSLCLNLSKFPKIFVFGSLVFIASWSLLSYLLLALVQDSNIPLEIDRIFQLNIYTFISVALLGLLFAAIFSFAKEITTMVLAADQSMANTKVVVFTLLLLNAIVSAFYFEINLFASLFPLLLISVLFIWGKPNLKRNHFAQGLSYLFLFSMCFATTLSALIIDKEKGERQVFAEQLRTDRDMVSELEFQKIIPKLKSDSYIKRLLEGKQTLFVSDFVDAVERRVFDDFWERYDLEFYLFDADGRPLVDNLNKNLSELDQLIQVHGNESTLTAGLFYLGGGFDEFSYIMRVPLLKPNGQQAYFYGTLKSKRIPEEIGFPRLLISKNAKVFEPLEKYSIAKYYKGQLLSTYGEFSYPTSFKSFLNDKHNEQGFYELNGFSHYVIHREDGGHLVMSAPQEDALDLLTNFSYLFSFFGLLILPVYVRRREKSKVLKNLTLSMKIQLVMISLVFVSLVVYGFGSGVFVKNQYNEFTNEVINEKLASVRLEFQSKFGKDSILDVQSSGNRMEYYLRKFARVFVTDINFYNQEGYLVATSRPRMFNVGLISEQMNPEAVEAMIFGNESSYIHQEQIGNLSYASAYLPFVGNDGELKGFLNLQHFGQQQDFENQIQKFLMAIVNVFMFLLAASVIVAVVVSGWLTAPLHLIQARFSKVNFGELNEPIEYDKDDEIGALIKEYNLKINELAITAQQLAQSERESAWREMAKQVAHEIKNPLTPMKLRLQHFQRLYASDQQMSADKVDEIVGSLVEQIDGLSRIANEFSNFAKMPTPNEELIDLELVVRNQISLFEDISKTKLNLNLEGSNFHVHADKDMLVRILNNLIKNSQQAIDDVDKAMINISVIDNEDTTLIMIQDNGKGISKEEQAKIFVPYFTTKSTGTGLGLAMVKQMVDLHKGKIWFESELGAGTKFYVELPKQ